MAVDGKKISELDEVANTRTDDFVVLDNSSTTVKLSVANLLNEIEEEQISVLKSNIATNKSNIATNKTNLKNATTYSTTETVIGTWIDGSAVYRKVIKWSGEIPTATETSIPHNITNLKRVISAFMFADSNGRFMPITSASETPTFVTTLCGWTSTALLVRTSGNWGSREWTIIVEYTK